MDFTHAKHVHCNMCLIISTTLQDKSASLKFFMLSGIIKLSVFFLAILDVLKIDICFWNYFDHRNVHWAKREKCVGKVKSYIIKAMFIFCKPVFFLRLGTCKIWMMMSDFQKAIVCVVWLLWDISGCQTLYALGLHCSLVTEVYFSSDFHMG